MVESWITGVDNSTDFHTKKPANPHECWEGGEGRNRTDAFICDSVNRVKRSFCCTIFHILMYNSRR